MPLLSSLKPTARKRVGKWASYLLALVIVVMVANTIDWATFGMQFGNLDVAAKMWPDILLAAVNTLWYTMVAFAIGTASAIVFAVLKLGGGPFGWFARAFIELFRGIPALLTIFACAYMIPIAFKGVRLPGGMVGAGLIGLILVTTAYTAEIIRAGIQAVPVGQREAARSLGMTSGQTMFWIILPQGIRIVIPPMTNEFVMLLKDTSLLFIAGLAMNEKELTTFARDAMTQNMNATPLVFAAVLYLIITVPLTLLVGKLERMAAKKQ